MIRLEHVRVERSGQPVLDGVDTQLGAGAVHVVIGPNGAGKTTLLSTLTGTLPMAAGRIVHDDLRLEAGRNPRRALQAWREHFAYMPQDCSCDAALTVLEVVTLGDLNRLGLHLGDEQLERAAEKLSGLGIIHLAGRQIGSLSGGQRQMVFFAQVLMREPRAMLLDEPVSALDLRHQVALLDRVTEETHAKGLVTLVVLHDLNLACQYADNLLVISGGKLCAAGHPREIVTEALLQDTYGVQVDILRDHQQRPVVQARSNVVATQR